MKSTPLFLALFFSILMGCKGTAPTSSTISEYTFGPFSKSGITVATQPTRIENRGMDEWGPLLDHDTIILFRTQYVDRYGTSYRQAAYIDTNRQSYCYTKMMRFLSNEFDSLEFQQNLKLIRSSHPEPFPKFPIGKDICHTWMRLTSYQKHLFLYNMDIAYNVNVTDSMLYLKFMDGVYSYPIKEYHRVSPYIHRFKVQPGIHNEISDKSPIDVELCILDSKHHIAALKFGDYDPTLLVSEKEAPKLDLINWTIGDEPDDEPLREATDKIDYQTITAPLRHDSTVPILAEYKPAIRGSYSIKTYDHPTRSVCTGKSMWGPFLKNDTVVLYYAFTGDSLGAIYYSEEAYLDTIHQSQYYSKWLKFLVDKNDSVTLSQRIRKLAQLYPTPYKEYPVPDSIRTTWFPVTSYKKNLFLDELTLNHFFTIGRSLLFDKECGVRPYVITEFRTLSPSVFYWEAKAAPSACPDIQKDEMEAHLYLIDSKNEVAVLERNWKGEKQKTYTLLVSQKKAPELDIIRWKTDATAAQDRLDSDSIDYELLIAPLKKAIKQ